MKKNLFLPLLFLLLLAITLFYGLVYAYPRFLYEQQQKLSSIEQTLKLESQLILLEQTYRNVLYIENAQKLFGIRVPTNRLLLTVDYRLRAGIDFEQPFQLIRKSGGEVLVRYSQPQIFSINAMPETLTLYNNWQLLGTVIRLNDFLPAIMAERDKIEQQALSSNYKSIVENNAQAFLTTYLTALGYQRLAFEVI